MARDVSTVKRPRKPSERIILPSKVDGKTKEISEEDLIRFRDLLLEKFSYDPDTGNLLHKTKGTNPKPYIIGSIASHANKRGYLVVGINYGVYRAHRLVWLMHYGTWPKIIDHANGIKSDNRLCNLREANHHQNSV